VPQGFSFRRKAVSSVSTRSFKPRNLFSAPSSGMPWPGSDDDGVHGQRAVTPETQEGCEKFLRVDPADPHACAGDKPGECPRNTCRPVKNCLALVDLEFNARGRVFPTKGVFPDSVQDACRPKLSPNATASMHFTPSILTISKAAAGCGAKTDGQDHQRQGLGDARHEFFAAWLLLTRFATWAARPVPPRRLLSPRET